MKPTDRIRCLPIVLILLITACCFSQYSYAQATCATAANLVPSNTCTVTTGNLKNATNAAPTGACGGATATTTFGVWYKFTATASTSTVTVSNLGTGLVAPYVPYLEVFSGACGTLTPISTCQAISPSLSVTLTGLTITSVYYIRVYTTTQGTSNPTQKWDFDICVRTPPSNDECSGAVALTSAITCSNTAGTLDLATVSSGIPVGCASPGNLYDVWYQFVAASSTQTVAISSLGANITSPEIQLFSGTCGALTSLQCGASSLTAAGLTVGATYYVRVSNVGTDPSGTSGFNICITHPPPPPANDDCAGAVNLSTAATCSNTAGTMISATASAGIPAGCEGAGTHYDVWYRFVAGATYELVSLSGLGSNFTNPAIQIYSGTCGTLTSLGCGTTSVAVGGLTVGATYYVRVSNVGSAITSNGGFNICVYHPAGASYDFGKSYVNITRNSGGGTINPGDTLEIRATLVIRSQSLDSLSFLDTLRAGGGVRFVPGSIVLRTNEGKAYKSFTDAFDSDAGYYYVSGTDTIIRTNIGVGASNVARGRLTNTSKPSVFGSTCIIMATYRVVVYANYATTINVGGGALTTRDGVTTIYRALNFQNRNASVYSSPGLCPGPVSATNAIGGDFNGTFGAPATGAPLARNRGTSTNVLGYIYKPFVTGGGPNDYYYGIANNTSATFTTVNSWPKPDSRRVFSVWDIIGDHTGAADPLKGNNPCDTTQPVSPTNPCGYMLVINSAYKTDTAFQYTVTNLCPNTYYEISAWLRNVCSKCSCDSNGVGTSGAGYIPFAPGDSSGVQPNLAFDINGTDYYTTGNIVHVGSTANQQRGSDSTNQWVKRGFTYVTGVAQTSLTLTIRNNAPGGGGNDWALDDISLATCLPNMNYSPSLAPTVCDSNSIVIYDTVRSYFNNYDYYKWQRSTDGGVTWTDVSAPAGPIVPTWNGSAWEYITSYTVPPANTTLANNGDRYRLIVATTSTNLANGDCQFTDGVSLISLNVVDCGVPLLTDLLSLSGAVENNQSRLVWVTSREEEPLHFTIEKSTDGTNFSPIGNRTGYNNALAEKNNYYFTDPNNISGKVWYRIVMSNDNNRKKYSRILLLNQDKNEFDIVSVINPFSSELIFNIEIGTDTKVETSLTDMFGKRVKSRAFTAYAGTNNLSINNTDDLAPGIYILQVKFKDKLITRKVMKK